MGIAPAEALLWLSALRTDDLPLGCTFGADLIFWQQVAQCTIRLLARQRFVPTIHLNDTAGWELLLSESADHEAFQHFADAIPPVCLQLQPARTIGFSPSEASALLSSFMNTCADALIRAWLADANLMDDAVTQDAEYPPRALLYYLSSPMSIHYPLSMSLNPSDLSRLRQNLQDWFAPARSAAESPAAPFRTCLRLEPPADDDSAAEAPWLLRIMLQVSDDASLLIPATEVWCAQGDTLRYLNKRLQQPQERLLSDLGAAARLFAPLERALQEPHPESCALSVSEAYHFLKEGAPLLCDHGIGVLLPSSWNDTATLRVRAHVSSPRSSGPSGLGLAEILSVDWEVLLGDHALSLAELKRLAALKVPLIHRRGQWVQLDHQRLAAALKEMEQRGQTISTGAALHLTSGMAEEMGGLPIVAVHAEGGVADLLRRLTGEERLVEVEPPSGFQGQLRPYQVRGLSWLTFLCERGIGACLADDMGLGKTVQIIALLLHERATSVCTQPTLLICPTSVVGNWQRELNRFAPSLRTAIHHGSERLRGEEFASVARMHDVVISTYALVYRDLSALSQVAWSGIILDEAQNIKNADTRQSQSLRSLSAAYRIALTGTPVENRLTELWSILDFLNPGYLGNSNEFRNRFAVPIERYQDTEAAALLRRVVQPFILRRVKTDPTIIQDLPEKQEMEVYVNLTSEQATLYGAVVEEMLQYLTNLFGEEVLFLHGGVSRSARNRMVEQFQQPEGGPRLFVLSLKAGGVGLNLTQASHVFHFDRWWNPAVENQATDRAFRIGQLRRVMVHKFISAGTIEEKIHQIIAAKQHLAEQVVEAGEGWLTELSNDQLRDLFRLA